MKLICISELHVRVIHLGCNYDRWRPSIANNPGIGLAGFLELGRALYQAFPRGTHRQIVFNAWGGGSFGSIGSTEFAQVSLILNTHIKILNVKLNFSSSNFNFNTN